MKTFLLILLLAFYSAISAAQVNPKHYPEIQWWQLKNEMVKEKCEFMQFKVLLTYTGDTINIPKEEGTFINKRLNSCRVKVFGNKDWRENNFQFAFTDDEKNIYRLNNVNDRIVYKSLTAGTDYYLYLKILPHRKRPQFFLYKIENGPLE